MTTQYRIQHINEALSRECLAERTHIYVNWPAVARGELDGGIQFDNAWYLVDRATGQIIAKDAQPAPPLYVSLAEAMAFGMPLPAPISTIGGQHVDAILRAMHAQRMEELLAPPKAEAGAEPGAV